MKTIEFAYGTRTKEIISLDNTTRKINEITKQTLQLISIIDRWSEFL